jgi:hypothetical protein
MDKREKVKDILVKYTEPVLKYDGITLHEVSGMIEKIYQEASDYEWEGEVEAEQSDKGDKYCYIANGEDFETVSFPYIKELVGRKIKITVREVI